VEEHGECGLRACDGEREPEGRVAFALAEQFEGRFEDAGGAVRGQAVEQIEAELPDPDALNGLAGELCRV